MRTKLKNQKEYFQPFERNRSMLKQNSPVTDISYIALWLLMHFNIHTCISKTYPLKLIQASFFFNFFFISKSLAIKINNFHSA